MPHRTMSYPCAHHLAWTWQPFTALLWKHHEPDLQRAFILMFNTLTKGCAPWLIWLVGPLLRRMRWGTAHIGLARRRRRRLPVRQIAWAAHVARAHGEGVTAARRVLPTEPSILIVHARCRLMWQPDAALVALWAGEVGGGVHGEAIPLERGAVGRVIATMRPQ